MHPVGITSALSRRSSALTRSIRFPAPAARPQVALPMYTTGRPPDWSRSHFFFAPSMRFSSFKVSFRIVYGRRRRDLLPCRAREDFLLRAPALNPSTSFFKVAIVCRPYTRPSTTTTGASAQEPKHATVCKVTSMSPLGPPASTPRSFSISRRRRRLPRPWQAGPRQMVKVCSPLGSKRN